MEECPFCTDKKVTLKEVKKRYIEHILKLCGYKKTRASSVLGVNPRLMREWARLGKIINMTPARFSDTGYKNVTSSQRDKYNNRSRY
jgi:hypothetical protein